jgi:hypothetical protein
MLLFFLDNVSYAQAKLKVVLLRGHFPLGTKNTRKHSSCTNTYVYFSPRHFSSNSKVMVNAQHSVLGTAILVAQPRNREYSTASSHPADACFSCTAWQRTTLRPHQLPAPSNSFLAQEEREKETQMETTASVSQLQCAPN